MQIFPTESAMKTLNSAISAFGSEDPAKFLQTMANAVSFASDLQDSVEDAIAATAGKVRENFLATASPYSRHSTDGVTYTLDEVCFTKDELQELRSQLVQAGAPVESLSQFDTLAEQPGGATLDQVMVSLKSSDNDVTVSDEDADAITGLLNPIDPSGTLSIQTLQALDENQPEKALALISEALDELSPTDTLEVSREGLFALGRALGLKDNTLQTLDKIFGDTENRTLFVAQVKALLAPVTGDLLSAKAAKRQLDAALEKTIKPILSKARDRMEREQAATSLQDKKAAQSKAMIDKTVQEKSRGILGETLASTQQGEAGDAAGRNGAKTERIEPDKLADFDGGSLPVKENMKFAGENLSRGAAGQNGQNLPERQPFDADFSGRHAYSEGGAHAGFGWNGQSNSGMRGSGENRRNWDELLSRIGVRNMGANASNVVAQGPVVYSMLQQGQPVPGLDVSSAGSAQGQALSRQVARQVESGLLTALRGGGSRLDLQLHPQELGAITITLTSRNGEVSAHIRSERSETAEMLSRQLDAIRVNLEQQGIKVDKVEVHLQQRDSQENSGYRQWQSADQHNSFQEEDARREELARLKNMANIRNNTTNNEDEDLEQPVQSMGQTAENAAGSLNLVA